MHNPARYVFLTDENYINTLLTTFKEPKDVTIKNLQEFFSNKIIRDENDPFKIKKVSLPRYFTTDEFKLKKDTLPCVKKDIITSVGCYIFNLYTLYHFGDRIDYFNEEITPGNLEKLQQKIIDLMLKHLVTAAEFGKFQTRAERIGFKGTLWNPGQSFDFVKVNPEVAKQKPILLKKWREAVDAGEDPTTSYVIMVEKPLLEIVKNTMNKNESWPIYERGGKPKFGNMYKNCAVSMGPVYDPVTGTYKIAENSFMEGIDNNMVPTYANIQVDAAYNRAVNTQDGGAKTKQIFAAMQSVKLNPKRGSDCGSRRYILKEITEKNIKENLLRYIRTDDGKLVKLTDENKDQFIGKTVKMRSPLFCCGEDYCNICAGDYFYELGIVNIGNTTVRASSTILQKSLKAMHDVSVNAVEIEPWKYIMKK